MNSRERIRTALQHQEADRVPLDIGGSDVTGIHWRAYESLCRRFGVDETIRLNDPIQGLAIVSDNMRDRLGVDTTGVWLNPTLTPHASLEDSRQAVRPLESHEAAPLTVDEWGTVFRLPEHGNWHEAIEYPLADATLRTFNDHPWPDPSDERRTSGVEEQARRCHQETDCAVVANFSGALLARGQLIRGPSRFLMELMTEPDLSAAILDRVLAYNISLVVRYLDVVGPYVDVIKISDDIGTQTSLLISPSLYRQMIKPRQREFIETIHAHTNAAILYHSCGAVRPLIGDFVEIGVDVLNPIQVSAEALDTAEMAREYGDVLCFWGAVDNQGILSSTKPKDDWNPLVEEEVRRRLTDLAPNGGYVCAASHNIQPDTPPVNVLTLCAALRRWGKYPLEEKR